MRPSTPKDPGLLQKELEDRIISSAKKELRECRYRLAYGLAASKGRVPFEVILSQARAATILVGKILKITHVIIKLEDRRSYMQTLVRNLTALLRWEFSEMGIPVPPVFVPHKVVKPRANLDWEAPGLTGAQWDLLLDICVSQRADIDYFHKYRRRKPNPSDRFLIEGIFWKLANGLHWRDLAGKYPVRRCQEFYGALVRSGRMQTIYNRLRGHLDVNGDTTLIALVERGCFVLSGNHILLAPSEKPTWEKYTALMLLQQGNRARRSICLGMDRERRRLGRYYRLPRQRVDFPHIQPNSNSSTQGGGDRYDSRHGRQISNIKPDAGVECNLKQPISFPHDTQHGRGGLDQGDNLKYNDNDFDKYYYHKHKDSTMDRPTVTQAITKYLDTVKTSRSVNTARTYSNGLHVFAAVLKENRIDPDHSPASVLTEDAVSWMADALKDLSPASEQLYLAATVRFYEYLAAEKLAEINLTRLRLLLRQRSRRPGQRLPQFPRNDIESVLKYVNNFTTISSQNPIERLRALRDRSFILTLADTGLRVHEACNLRRGDIDWNEGRAIIIGKGDKQAVVRFSSRCLASLKDYLSARAALDGGSGRPLPSLPLFARHDKGAGTKVKPMTTTTGRNIVSERVRQALGDQAEGRITPHSFRHYFVTTVLRASGNLKLAQELARHASIQVTQRYAHISDDELDKGYHDIFEK
jgi:integrase/recombinase XerC